MAEFLVMSRRDANQQDAAVDPVEMRAIIQRYLDWTEDLRARGKLKAARRLLTDGRVLSPGAVTDGPFVEGNEVVGGFWLIEAADIDEALAIVETHPHCRVWPDGSLEVRPIFDIALYAR